MKFGCNRIYSGTNKTLEGTLGGIFSSLLAVFLIGITYEFYNIEVYLTFFLTLVIGFFYEGITLEIDNLFLPLFCYKLFLVLQQ